jgi:hypothetical protein
VSSTILTGTIEKFENEEFEAFVQRIIEGAAVTLGDAERCSETQWQKLRGAVFMDVLEHANAAFASGRSRGRQGAMIMLSLCKNALEAVFPESKGRLQILDEILLALAKLDGGELPYLLRPGLDSNDRRKHLSVVPTENGDE